MTKEDVAEILTSIFASFGNRNIEAVTIEEIAEKIFSEIVMPAVEAERNEWIKLTAVGRQ